MRKGRKFLATLLTFVCLMATSMSVMAAEPQTTPEVTTEAVNVEAVEAGANVARSSGIYGYAADYTNYEADSFTVNAPGTASSTGHATIKTSDFGSSTQIVYVSIYRPDGTLAKGNVKLTGNQEKVVSFTNAQSGTYNIAYAVNGVYKGWVHCWIYQ